MNKFFKISLLTFIIVSLSINIWGQEVEIGLNINPVIKNYLKKHPAFTSKSLNADTLELPFFDDFSSYSIFPADTLWEDADAYINNGYPVRPVTIGVATLDALDQTGSLHSNASSNEFIADYLTSKPINLSGLSYADSIYLSFYYQPQGTADYPEAEDSLVLEFYAPSTDEWHWAWSKAGSSLKDFKAVIVRIPDTSMYYQSGFKFRFKNYASLTGLFEASWASNADQWNLDYIYLNKNRTPDDTVIIDLAFLTAPDHLLDDYTSMPWRHFQANNEQMAETFNLSFVNHHENGIVVNREIEIYDLVEGGAPYEVIGGGGASENFPPGDTTISHNFNYYFTSSSVNFAKFLVKAHITPGEIVADFSPNNDTASYIQIFDNYYAHDDGSPESGYGIGGEGSQNALVANKFFNYQSHDTLRAIDMYFNQTIGDASQQYFYLKIWSNNEATGMPDTVIFSQIGLRPEYGDSLFKFHRYFLQNEAGEDTAITVPSIFYVGWKQTTTDLLNIGFDKNSILNTDDDPQWENPWMFYNVTGNWQQSSFEGSLMIRPVFSLTPLVGIEELAKQEISFSVYPNPSTGFFTIKTKDYSKPEYYVFSSNGSLLLSGKIDTEQTQLDLSNLPNGIYYIRLADATSVSKSKKLVIIH